MAASGRNSNLYSVLVPLFLCKSQLQSQDSPLFRPSISGGGPVSGSLVTGRVRDAFEAVRASRYRFRPKAADWMMGRAGGRGCATPPREERKEEKKEKEASKNTRFGLDSTRN